jgi:protocatechuate 3,4-dioxygenase beta subunit
MAMTKRREVDQDLDPPYLYPEYVATRTRSPRRPLVLLPHSLTELSGPVLGADRVQPGDADLTARGTAEALGERIIVHGRVLDSDGRPVRNALVEVWQANAGGRYAHENDLHPAPLDPNFDGLGRVVTDERGRYRFVTIKPGPYPWRNSLNAWRASHIHFSLFGDAFIQRLVTQMYFPGDPLFGQDPIFKSVPDPRGRQRMISRLDLPESVAEWALAFRFDIVLRGREQTPMEDQDDDA